MPGQSGSSPQRKLNRRETSLAEAARATCDSGPPHHGRLGRPARHRAIDETAQVLVLVLLALIPLLGFAGLVIDIGNAYYSQRALQGTADAAALAGASQMPDTSAAATVAAQFGSGAGAKNPLANLSGITETISTKCDPKYGGCVPDNAVVVNESATVNTFFVRLFGVNTFALHAKATACGPCGGRPADVVVIFDRTGSMCEDFNGNPDPSCAKLTRARQGIETLLSGLDPGYDHVGLVVLPPASSMANRCSTPPSNAYNSLSALYLFVPLSSDYQVAGTLDHSSQLVSMVDCLRGAGTTSYATAIEQAQAELDRNGRPEADHVIVFFTDGAANTGPTYYPTSSPYRMQPCHQGITSAAAAKGKKTTIYSVGYTLSGGGGNNKCASYTGANELPAITSYSALQSIASRPDTFFNQPAAGDLNAIFAAIATKIAGPRLILDG